jgi:integrase/recombinase XerD
MGVQEFKSWKNDKVAHLSGGAKSQQMGRIREFLRDKDKEDIADGLDYNYSAKTQEQREERTEVLYIETTDYKKILDATESLREKLIVQLLWECGLRRSEISELRLKDVNLEEGYLVIDTKKNEDNFRDVPFSVEIKPTLRDWMEYGGRSQYSKAEDSKYLIVTQHSEQVRPNYINKIARRVADRAGISREITTDAKDNTRWFPTARHFRNSYATHRAKNGMNLKKLKKLMGHSHVETTSRYVQVDIEDKIEANKRYRPKTKDEAEEVARNL